MSDPKPIDLSVILGYCQKATPGPWRERYSHRHDPPGTLIGAVAPGHQIVMDGPGGNYPFSDLKMIVNSRTDLPAVTEALIEALRLLDCAPSDDAPADLILWTREVHGLLARFTGWEDKERSA